MQPEWLRHYGCQYLDDADIQAVVDALNSPLLTGGTHVSTFEAALAKFVDSEYAVSCGNCTQGLQLACHALGVGPGMSVIVPAVTFLATANAPRLLGADIVFADVDPQSGLMEAHHLEEALKRCPSRPYAVMPVHLAGQLMDIRAIHDVARAHNLIIIEDAAHAIGTSYTVNKKSYKVGDCTFSDAVAFSFHPVKHITTAEGGAVLVRDEALYKNLKALRSHGMVRDVEEYQYLNRALNAEGKLNPWYYEMPDIGYNFRMTDIQAALGLSQLKKLPEFIAKRASLVRRYDKNLISFGNAVQPIKKTAGCNAAWHIYPVLIDFSGLQKDRGNVMRELLDKGIGSQVHYIPVHTQPYYHDVSSTLTLRGAESYYAHTLTLPLHVHMDESHVDYVVQTLGDVLEF